HHVEQHEVRARRLDQLERLLAVSCDVHGVAPRGEQVLERDDDVRLIVGDHDAAPHAAEPTGRVNEKQAPRPRSLSTHIRPPKCSTIWRLMCRPSPLPSGLLVSVSPPWRNLSKMTDWSAWSIPGPLSRTSTRSAPSARESAMRICPF